MSKFIDLSHVFENGIPGFRLKNEKGVPGRQRERYGTPRTYMVVKRRHPHSRNLTGLDQLYGKGFRFYSIPLRAKGAAAFPIRAFAELKD